MKKLLITSVIAVSALGVSFAQESPAVADMPPVLPPAVTTGEAKVDEQIRALRAEMEVKLKALHEEYRTKLKAIVGNRKVMMASSTKPMMGTSTKDRPVMGTSTKERPVMGTSTKPMMRPEVRGASTTNATPNGNAWGFFKRFFGINKPAATSTQQ